MRMKILLGVFLIGILFIGLGVGIAFAEYSSFTYGGDVILGTEKQEVETMEYIISMGNQKTRINNYTMKALEIVEDKQLKDGQVRVEIIANPDYIKSFLDFEDYDANRYDSYDPNYISGFDGEIQIYTGRAMDDWALFMEHKDDFLQNLKAKVIKNYYLEPIKSVTVKANKNTLEHLEY